MSNKQYKRFIKLKRKHKAIQRKLAREQKKLNRALWEVFGA